MNGELLMQGYKFSEKLLLNLQEKTVLTGEDTFLAFEVFNMLENYFNRKDFSDYYLDKGTVLILNGTKLSGSEFAVFRITPTINLVDQLKISKKSILGQAAQATFAEDSDKISNLMSALQENVLSRLNTLTEGYRVSFACEEADIFTVAKVLQPRVQAEGGQDILQQEHDQFCCKEMMLDFVAKLETNKKKLLLVELPEYGLNSDQITKFFKALSVVPIDNIIIYTHKKKIYQFIPQVFNYHFMKDGGIYGFDDYDELETQLQNVGIGRSRQEIEQEVMDCIFNSQDDLTIKGDFTQLVNDFFKRSKL